MEDHGFQVTRKLHLETAWKATYSWGSGGRTIGVNSEVSFLILAEILLTLRRWTLLKASDMHADTILLEFLG